MNTTDAKPEKVQEPQTQTGSVVALPLWSKWQDSKGKFWVIVARSGQTKINGEWAPATIECLDLEREFVQPFSSADLYTIIEQGRLKRIGGVIAVSDTVSSTINEL